MSASGRAETRPPRAGEELPVETLEPWLRAHVPEVSALPGPLVVEQFPGGHSNLTYLLRLGGRELVLRRPPRGSKVKTAHDMGREVKVLEGLHPVYPKAPRVYARCDDPAVLGAPFYVMERVSGLILRKPTLPEGLDFPPPRMRAVSEALVDGLVELHAVDVAAAGLASLGKPEGYVERQVRGWSERYLASKTDDVPDMDEVARWLAEHLAPSSGATLVHNDYKYDNVVLDPADPTRIRAVLDWEMATYADPLLDLGTSLAYWVDPDDADELKLLPVGPTTHPGNLSRAGVVERYAAKTGRDCSGIVFHYAFGLFKVAVIAQQIYYRYAQGLTKDERFASMIFGVFLLSRTAARAIEKGRIDRLEG